MHPTFQGEVMLAGWTETHNGGAKVTLWLPDPGDLDTFRGMTVRKGNVAGQRLACVLVEIGDDEKPSPETDAAIVEAATEKVRGGDLARLAGMLCNDPEFQKWMHQMNRGLWAHHRGRADSDAEAAAAIVRGACGVKSRAELDHNFDAAEVFHNQFRRPWLEYNAGRG